MKFTKRERNAVAKTSDGGPDIGTWLNRIRALGNPLLTEAVEGIWCGKEGRETIDLPGTKSMLCVGWYSGKVEWSYLS